MNDLTADTRAHEREKRRGERESRRGGEEREKRGVKERGRWGFSLQVACCLPVLKPFQVRRGWMDRGSDSCLFSLSSFFFLIDEIFGFLRMLAFDRIRLPRTPDH